MFPPLETKTVSAAGVARLSGSREAAAYHEAGHAVVARRLDFDVVYVTLRETEDANGHCMIIKAGWQGSSAQVAVLAEALLIQTMAGPLAEAKFTADPTSDGSDYDDKSLIAEYLPKARRSRQDLGEEALALVQGHWATITDVASELLRVGRISGDRLDIIINRVEPPQ
ncbi:hypothetical protein [Bradyrhizobium sp. 27S5]|uniref:hypothetical protein n=1 Tax=Bradyrhizobium sp. 27S5 TaxID=3139728 RepID=UPI0030D57B30